MKQRGWIFYIVVLIVGALIGSAMGEIVAFIIPAGVVQQFFLKSATASIGPGTFNIIVLTFTLGFSIKVNIVGVIGILIAAYALRWID
jgi:uncharacterized membrane protein